MTCPPSRPDDGSGPEKEHPRNRPDTIPHAPAHLPDHHLAHPGPRRHHATLATDEQQQQPAAAPAGTPSHHSHHNPRQTNPALTAPTQHRTLPHPPRPQPDAHRKTQQAIRRRNSAHPKQTRLTTPHSNTRPHTARDITSPSPTTPAQPRPASATPRADLRRAPHPRREEAPAPPRAERAQATAPGHAEVPEQDRSEPRLAPTSSRHTATPINHRPGREEHTKRPRSPTEVGDRGLPSLGGALPAGLYQVSLPS